VSGPPTSGPPMGEHWIPPSLSIGPLSDIELPSPRNLLVDLEEHVHDSPRYAPTVPICESGSPRKDPAAPIDPTAPRVGDTFESLVALIHYVQEYERSRGFTYKKGEQEKDKRGLSLFCMLSFSSH
jgi:hypothetical protein